MNQTPKAAGPHARPSARQRIADKKTARAMADCLIRLAGQHAVEPHHLSRMGFAPADVARLGPRAIDIAARRRPDLYHGTTMPAAYAVRRGGVRTLRTEA
jgi:hypothetical protein